VILLKVPSHPVNDIVHFSFRKDLQLNSVHLHLKETGGDGGVGISNLCVKLYSGKNNV
jgi:hypothetical protein